MSGVCVVLSVLAVAGTVIVLCAEWIARRIDGEEDS